jgi:protocatechuate 3,4-dioxygenase, beta subunit
MILQTAVRPPDPSPNDPAAGAGDESKEIELVRNGYTISTRVATLARVGDEYVMRKRGGHRIALPTLIDVDTLTRTWTAFRRLTAIDAAIQTDPGTGDVNALIGSAPRIEAGNAPLAVGRTAIDLSRINGRSALGDRITVCGRVLDEADRPVSDATIEIWQSNAAGRYRHDGHNYDAPLDENFGGNVRISTGHDGWYRFTTIRPGTYPNRGLLRPNHIHYVLLGSGFESPVFTEMYFPGDPLLPLDPILNSECSDPAVRDRLVARFDHDVTSAELGLGYRFDLILRGNAATPLANKGKHSWLGA